MIGAFVGVKYLTNLQNARYNNKDTYLYVHLCTKVPLCSDMELMKSAPVDVPNWSSCMVGTLEKRYSRHNESYKPRPSLKLQGLLFRLTPRVLE